MNISKIRLNCCIRNKSHENTVKPLKEAIYNGTLSEMEFVLWIFF